MKIALPVNDDKNNVCIVFGRTPYFAVKDTETGSIDYILNPAAEAQGGAGIKAAQAVADSGADALITFRLGQNSAEVFKAAGIKIYKAQGESAEDNFIACEEGTLSELTQFHEGYHGRR